ncbi:MAG: transglutaminaseTgpA domain-containing protein [Verrucomicrobiota bacterium]
MKRRKSNTTLVRWNLHTVSLTGIVLAMGYAGAVQNNGVAYGLCFVTLVLGLMSWLRARENLRGVEVSMGRLGGGKAGEMARLPLELHAATGQGAWGVEVISAEGDGRWTFLEEVPAGQSSHVSVPVKITQAGVQQSVRVLLRSAYPLGFFSAEREIEIATSRRIHPKAEGKLPLPKPDRPIAGQNLATSPAGGRPGREGDDFAGLREYHAGDSLKHVDWRAVARGRPMLVKQWSSGSTQAVTLDWEKLDLPDTARASQIARWIEEAEINGTPYAMRLPGMEIDASIGPAHAQRCLDALSETSAATQETAKRTSRLPAGHEHSAHLPPWPLLVLCIILSLASLLMLDVVPTSAVALFFGCVGLRLGLLEKGWRPKSKNAPAAGPTHPRSATFLGLSVLVAGLILVKISTGTLFSMESGIAVLLVLLGGKLIESRTPHDFQVLSLVGWFLCLCCLLSTQTLSRSLWTFGIFAGIAICMVRFRRGADGWLPPLRLTSVMLAQALPVAAVLFFVFPRSSLGFLERLGTERTHVTGISSMMEPGKISKIAASDAVSFRVEFPDSEPPEPTLRYWRCLVLWQCDDGLTWQKGLPVPGASSAWPTRHTDSKQIITLEPHGQKWLPGLDIPIHASDDGGTVLPDSDDTLSINRNVDNLRRFTVTSRLTQQKSDLSESQKSAALRLPANISPRLQALAKEVRGQGRTNTQIAQEAVLHLQKLKFEYTLEPGSYEGPNALDEFLFERRVGFCEHFSGAFATLMRAAGVPARIVIGYMGGEWSDRGGYLIVRQADAHAWTEIWLENQGWTRVDPTAALVPARMTLDLRTLLAGGEEELERQRGSFLWRSLTSARLWWDSVEYDWYNTVISFDEESQIAWMNWLGLGQLRGHWMIVISLVVMLLSLLGLLFWLRRPAPARDPWLRLWLQLCRKLERLGAPARKPSEGPLNYAERVAKAKPGLASQVRSLAREYAETRYGSGAAAQDWRAFQKSLQSVG